MLLYLFHAHCGHGHAAALICQPTLRLIIGYFKNHALEVAPVAVRRAYHHKIISRDRFKLLKLSITGLFQVLLSSFLFLVPSTFSLFNSLIEACCPLLISLILIFSLPIYFPYYLY